MSRGDGMTDIERKACPRCGDPGFVNIGGERLCGNAGCDHTEPFETDVETITIPAADWRSALAAERERIIALLRDWEAKTPGQHEFARDLSPAFYIERITAGGQ